MQKPQPRENLSHDLRVLQFERQAASPQQLADLRPIVALPDPRLPVVNVPGAGERQPYPGAQQFQSVAVALGRRALRVPRLPDVREGEPRRLFGWWFAAVVRREAPAHISQQLIPLAFAVLNPDRRL